MASVIIFKIISGMTNMWFFGSFIKKKKFIHIPIILKFLYDNKYISILSKLTNVQVCSIVVVWEFQQTLYEELDLASQNLNELQII